MASGVESMIQSSPPVWIEWLLAHILPPRDRETISGDLLEEYREEQLPRLGRGRANLWYLNQSISFLSVRSLGGPPMKMALTWMSVFIAVAGGWLAFMEYMLKHSGYGQRMGIGAGIAVQGIATLLLLLVDGRSLFRKVILAGALGGMFLGLSAIKRVLNSQHFEGFVVLIGSALIIQGLLTLAVVLRTLREKTR